MSKHQDKDKDPSKEVKNATQLGTAEHHQEAAVQLELAAKHHRAAASFHASGDLEAAGNQAHIAHGHILQAVNHAEEAIRKHSAEYVLANET